MADMMAAGAGAPQGAGPEMAAQEGQPQEGQERAASDIVAGVNSALLELKQLLDQNPQMQAASQKLDGLIQGYQQIVNEDLLGEAPQSGPETTTGQVPMEAGAAQVSPRL